MNTSNLIFIGTGTSEGIPRVSCLTRSDNFCKVCKDSIIPGSFNRRRNTSVLITRKINTTEEINIMIDVGKFFYESAINLFPRYNIKKIDSIILTHTHADAVGGLDDLRDWTNNTQKEIKIYLRKKDLKSISSSHSYLVKRNKQSGGGVAKLNFNIINKEPFTIKGITFTPLPVMHGPYLDVFGFRFGNVSYISDTSLIPKETEKIINGTEILILDALRPEKTHGTHFSLEQAVEFTKKIKPKITFFTNATHDIDHLKINNLLKRETPKMQYAFDGQKIKIKI
tara:strand:- start:186 stop:1034 length:849 start_codon:yes stop_codon:yes gene_type:complete